MNRLLSGHVFDALAVSGQEEKKPSVADVVRLIQNLAEVTWQHTETVGKGEDDRAQSGTGDYASALVLNGSLVHCNLMTAV